jgi:transglutaminase-like putative cysteine protease
MAEPGRRRAAPELGVAALVASAALPLSRLFREGGITPTILGAVSASALVAWALRRARIVVVGSAILSFVAFTWWAGFALFPSGLWGPFPTAATVRSLFHALSEGVRASKIEVSPVPSAPEFLTLVAFAVWALAWAADDAVQKLRHPLLAIGFTLPVFVFPGTLLESSRRWFDIALYLGAALWVLFTDERLRLARWGRAAVGDRPAGWRPGLAARIGVVVVIASIAFAPLIPGYARPPGISTPHGEGFGTLSGGIGLNPLISIKPRLQSVPVVPLFRVTSKVASYWRVTSLDRFDGRLWTSPNRPLGPSVSGRSITPGTRPPHSVRVTQTFEIRNLGGPWMPAAFEPVRVDGLRAVRTEPVSRTLVQPGELRPGMRIKVTSVVALPDASDLDRAGEVTDTRLDAFLRLPASLPPTVTVIARQLTAGASTPFRRALALQNYLRTFTYDEDVAAGHGFDDLITFLTKTKRGYCEQFAGSMAVLARAAGLPARVAIGYAVGEPTGADQYRVTTRHAHAWVEIFFPGQGWLAFEPTPRPDATIVPAYTRSQVLAPSIGETPSTAGSASPTPGDEGVDPRLRERDEPVGPIAPARTKPVRWWILLGPIAAVALAALPGAATGRRLLRRRRARTAVDRIGARYLDFLDWCTAVGVPRGPGETPAEHARRLAAGSPPAEAPLIRLAQVACRALYAPVGFGDPEEARSLGRSSQRALARGLPVRIRARPMIGWGWWRTP